jgi:hypothetical protein
LICTIDLPKIAEARVAYGGPGVLTNTQQVPWGQQALDIVLPFLVAVIVGFLMPNIGSKDRLVRSAIAGI